MMKKYYVHNILQKYLYLIIENFQVEKLRMKRTFLQRRKEKSKKNYAQYRTFDIFHEHVHEHETFFFDLITNKTNIFRDTPQVTEYAKLIWLKKRNLKSLV